MQYQDMVRAVVCAIAFTATLAGHFVGDHWAQTDQQACRKSLGAGYGTARAIGNCALHVAGWTVCTVTALVLAAWWLNLPLQPVWLTAGVALNAITHFVADLRTPLIRIARLLGRAPYIDRVQVHRAGGLQVAGPGTGLFWLDQSWHIAWAFVAALLIAGPPA